jgi:hypothetical protein
VSFEQESTIALPVDVVYALEIHGHVTGELAFCRAPKAAASFRNTNQRRSASKICESTLHHTTSTRNAEFYRIGFSTSAVSRCPALTSQTIAAMQPYMPEVSHYPKLPVLEQPS